MDRFSWRPSSVESLTTGYRVQVTEFESGKEQRIHRGRQPRVWELVFEKTPYAELQAIRAFYESRKGPFEAFLWFDGWSGQDVTVRFQDDAVTWETQWRVNGWFTLTLREVL